MRSTLDLDALRALVCGVDLQSFAKAAKQLGRSTSALSAQMKKLEHQARTPIFRKAGRGLALTPAGETLLTYARRLLELNDEATIAVAGVGAEGVIRVGVQEDFAGSVLATALGRFSRAHPGVLIEARVARHADLLSAVTAGALDFALAWDDGGDGLEKTAIASVPVHWLAGGGFAPPQARSTPLPLVAVDGPCWFHAKATMALAKDERTWRVALSSASLAGVWSAVAAGLGLAARTRVGAYAGVSVLDAARWGLPQLDPIGLALHRSGPIGRTSEVLADIIAEEALAALRTDRGLSLGRPLHADFADGVAE